MRRRPPASTGWLPVAPLTQPPMMAENRPAPPPACTSSSPPGRNFGSVSAGERARACPSAMPPAPRTISLAGRAAAASCSSSLHPRRGPSPPRGTPGRARADDEHGVEAERRASGGARCAGTPRASAASDSGVARQLVDDAARTLAGEQRDRVGRRREAAARPTAAPTASPPRPRRSRTLSLPGLPSVGAVDPARAGRRRRCGRRAAARGRWSGWRGCPARAR